MILLLDITLCLLNLSMALFNYKKKNYIAAMVSMFAAGFILAIAIMITI